MPPPFTWTGFYIGVNAGGIWPSGGRSASIFDPDSSFDGGFLASSFPGGLGSQSAGFLGGGQAGYNWQTGAFVLGVETDFDGSTVSKDFNFSSTPFGGPGIFGGDVLNVNAKREPRLAGNKRRAAASASSSHAGQSPDDLRHQRYRVRRRKVRISTSLTARTASSSPAVRALPGSAGRSAAASNTRSPTTSTDQGRIPLSAPDLGSNTINTVGNAAVTEFFPGSVATARFSYNASIFRAAVNYKFLSAPPSI